MNEPVIVQKKPFEVEVKEGEDYAWCSCGRSAKQPFCEGSHRGSDFRPVHYIPETDRTVRFCGCKKTGKAPMCDGAHKSL